MQRKRVLAAGKRLQKIGSFSRVVRSTRKCVRTGALPQALWGIETLGLAPSNLTRLRAKAAAATGIVSPGRCPKTAIILGFGRFGDPLHDIAKRMVVSWWSFWHAAPLLLKCRLRIAWRKIHRNICTPSWVRWHCVNGPIAALIATLSEAGWHMAYCDVWTDPAGDNFVFDPEVPMHLFVTHVMETISEHLWSQAETHYASQGLKSQPDWAVPLVLHRSWKKRLENKDSEHWSASLLVVSGRLSASLLLILLRLLPALDVQMRCALHGTSSGNVPLLLCILTKRSLPRKNGRAQHPWKLTWSVFGFVVLFPLP